MNIGDILKEKLEYFKKNPEKALAQFGKEYTKERNACIQDFADRVNQERKFPLPFMAYYQKLQALQEIDDLRWFYFTCQKYSRTKDKQGNQNTFSKCFWGALK